MSIWDKYYKRPVDEIEWNKVQADFFYALVDSEKIKGRTALDLGCGIGTQSIYLAKHGFQEVVGVDIVQKAIDHANKNAEKDGVQNLCKFIRHDTLDWSYLEEDKKFDHILDWAHIHCLPKDRVQEYARSIQDHLTPDGTFLVRSFCSKSGDDHFKKDVDGTVGTVCCYTRQELQEFFPQMEIIEENVSSPQSMDTVFFNELFMRKYE